MKIAAIQNISSFSLLESPTKVKDLLITAKNKGYEAVGLTDINITYGLVDFFELAKEVGIKPLLGMQVRINGLIDSNEKYDLIVLAKNNQGYKNILKLSSAINLLTENGNNKKILTLEKLSKYLENLVVITPANVHSELVMLYQSNQNLGSDYIRKLKKLIPTNSSLYLGVYANKSQKDYIDYLHSLARQFDLSMVGVEDVQYLYPRQQFLQKTLAAIKNNHKLQDVVALSKQKGSHFMLDASELVEKYHEFGLDEAVKNTWKVAEECTAEVTFQKPVLPKYHQNKFPSSKEYLHYLAQSGLEEKFKDRKVPVQYQQQLNYELKIINEMGFDDYFLIVWDVINFCHRVNITTGPGRGSACGSLVSYALKITQIDPIKYNLLFERFLNPARHEMPDIDLDIPDNRRDEVIKHMYQKYGMDHAAQILTFGTLAAKQALRDVGRAFGYSLVEIDKWTRAIPKTGKLSLNKAYENSRDLRIIVDSTPENKLLFQTARAIENLPRHYSIHAAGLVISDDSIAGISALQDGQLKVPVTQQTKKYVEALGLLKIDFLGLRNLTILGNTLELIRGQGIKINPDNIPLNDRETLELFQNGNTDAVFQFESNGIRNVLIKLHPDNFEDLVAVNALYRPGPMQNIDLFINRKKGKAPIRYPDPSLKPILSSTYGILVYQEQVMQTAQILAGFSLGEADLLRRAMSKKQQEIIDKQRQKFINGVIKNGHPKEVGERVYNYIEQFANYGFNRSHAVAYTKMAFWLAYLKVHFPDAFFTALLNSGGSGNKTQNYIAQAQEAGIKILPPDINKSAINYTLDNRQILVGLKAIKGLRNDFVNQIVSLKKPIKDISDFLRKIDSKFLQVDAIKALIKAGAFDSIEPNRNKLLENCADIVENIRLTGDNLSLSESLGGIRMADSVIPTANEKAEMEEEVLGFSTATSPLIAVQKYAKKFNARPLNHFFANETGISVGRLTRLKQIRTKKGDPMAFAVFEDTTNSQDVTIFPKIYEKIANKLKEGKIYILGLRVQNDKFDPQRKQYLLTNLREVHFIE